MNRRQKIIVSVTGIFLVLLILVGLTYAYFLTQIQGNENNTSISVTTAKLELVYGDGNGILETDKLEPSNDFINFKDSEGNPVPSKIFTVTNKGNATVEGYKVYLEKVQNQLERKDDLVYTLSCKAYTNYGENNQAELESGCNGVSDETTFPSVITSIVSNDINVGVTHVYELKVKYKEMGVDQSVDMNKLITAKINIYDSTTKFLARAIIDNAQATPATNKTLYIEPTLQDGTNYTIPAHATSLENERILTYTMDDLGTSYYYRGNPIDNYVTFAGMCWRIIRIVGDGSTKLILEDQDQPCSTSINGNWAIPRTTGASTYTGNFGHTVYYGHELTASDGTKNSSTKYLMDYLHGKTNSDGSMATAFKNFQSTFTEKELSKLKSGNWCLGDNAYDNSNNSLTATQILDNKIKGISFIYDSYRRLSGNVNGYQPTLKCNGTTMNDWDDAETNPTPMYVGTITADEIVYAGGKYGTNNLNYYLINEEFKKGESGANKANYFWTLSPSYFDDEYDLALGVEKYGDLYGFYVDGDDGWSSSRYHAFRPSVSLASSAAIISGDGTLEKPYIIG